MHTTLRSRKFHFLIYFFISYFSFGQIPTTLAQGLTAKKEPPAASPRQPSKVVVVELQDGKAKFEATEKVTATLRDELATQEEFTLVSKDETDRFLLANPDLFLKGEAGNPLDRYLKQAMTLYMDFQFKPATGMLENVIDLYREGKTNLNEAFSLHEAYLVLGNIYMGAKNSKRASEVFQESVRLDPTYVMPEADYPPPTREVFEKAREQYLKKAGYGVLEITSSPSKSQVFINGVLKGETPFKLDKLSLGEHFILLKNSGYYNQGQKIKVEAKGTKMKLSLKKMADFSGPKRGIYIEDLQNVNEQVRLGSILGKAMGANKVVLVSLEEIGWNHKITARMVDVAYQASYKHKSVEVIDLPKDTRKAAQVIAQDLNAYAKVDLGKEPKKYTEGEVVVVGTKKRSKLMKSPWLWTAIGVVVAGSATGLYFGLRDRSSGFNVTTQYP